MTPDGNLTPALNPDAAADAVLVEHGAGRRHPRRIRPVGLYERSSRHCLLAALIFFLVRLVVLNFRVDGESMLPNLDDGEMLLVNRNAYQYVDISGDRYYPFDPPERGDVIVFDPPTGSDKPYIKRIIGLPGEEVTFGDGNVFINGKPCQRITSRIARDAARGPIIAMSSFREGYVYVLGDQPQQLSDSRVFGPVPVGNIVGKAWLSYWPRMMSGLFPTSRTRRQSRRLASSTPRAYALRRCRAATSRQTTCRSPGIGPARNSGCKLHSGPVVRAR